MNKTPLFHPTSTPPDFAPLQNALPAASTWTCQFCGTSDIHSDLCPTCGAARIQAIPPDVFLLDPAHRDIIQGKTRKLKSPLNGCAVIFMIPFVLGGLFVIAVAANGWWTALMLNLQGVTVQGQVSDMRVRSDSEEGNTYYITYRFSTTGERGLFVKEQTVSAEFYSSLHTGSTLRVTYNRSDPGMSKLTDGSGGEAGMNLFLTVFGAVWNLVVFGMLIGIIQKRRRTKRLNLAGRLIHGEIVSCSGSTDGEGDFRLSVCFTFRSPAGSRMKGSEVVTRNDLKEKKLPGAGKPIMVMYADDKCYEML